ncbi:MAG: tocopherol cyclase family protein [Myxococcota bacterium]
MGLLTATLHPEGFHGRGKTKRFFEGWYVKLVSKDLSQRWAVIPGVFLGAEGGGEAFVQVLDGLTHRSWYRPFPLADFHAEEGRFDVRVGGCRFSPEGVELSGDLPLQGKVRFATPLTPWPVTLTSPGIMGWYAWVPFMECYHGIVSFSHALEGTLEVEGRSVSFDGGDGYLEKDWGQAFPSAYVWAQANHFSTPGTSVTGSVAIIPWLFSSFRGTIAGVWHEKKLYRFATYTGAKLERFELDDTHVRMTWADRAHRLELTTERRSGGLLHAPVRTEMHKRVEESMDGELHVRLTTHDGKVLLDDVGRAAGLEVHGDLERLVQMK